MKHIGRIITECSHTVQVNGQSHFIFSTGSTSIIVDLRHGRTSVQCCHIIIMYQMNNFTVHVFYFNQSGDIPFISVMTVSVDVRFHRV